MHFALPGPLCDECFWSAAVRRRFSFSPIQPTIGAKLSLTLNPSVLNPQMARTIPDDARASNHRAEQREY
jgi:hypothetical protein